MARVEEGFRVGVATGEALAGADEAQDAHGRGAFARLPWIAALIIVVLVVAAVGAPLIAPHSPTEQSLPDKLLPPAWQEGGNAKYLLGTDVLGRDVLSRLLCGGSLGLQLQVLVRARVRMAGDERQA